ncbi:MAG: hypothetical protein OSA95_14445, partial [Opitutales bacterium]|nr:hypothetical protein [Opitutales bacterium]
LRLAQIGPEVDGISFAPLKRFPTFRTEEFPEEFTPVYYYGANERPKLPTGQRTEEIPKG